MDAGPGALFADEAQLVGAAPGERCPEHAHPGGAAQLPHVALRAAPLAGVDPAGVAVKLNREGEPAVGRPAGALDPTERGGMAVAPAGRCHHLDRARGRMPDVDPRPALEVEELVVGSRHHRDPRLVGRDAQRRHDALFVDELLRSPALQIEAPHLRELRHAMAIFNLLVAGPQILPLVVGPLGNDGVVEGPAVGGELGATDPFLDARHGHQPRAVRRDPPHLRLTVVGRGIVTGAADVGREVNKPAVRAPLWGSLLGPVKRQPLPGLRGHVDDPQIGIPRVVRPFPALLDVGDARAVGRHRKRRNGTEGEIVVDADLVGARELSGGGAGDQYPGEEHEAGGTQAGHGSVSGGRGGDRRDDTLFRAVGRERPLPGESARVEETNRL